MGARCFCATATASRATRSDSPRRFLVSVRCVTCASCSRRSSRCGYGFAEQEQTRDFFPAQDQAFANYVLQKIGVFDLSLIFACLSTPPSPDMPGVCKGCCGSWRRRGRVGEACRDARLRGFFECAVSFRTARRGAYSKKKASASFEKEAKLFIQLCARPDFTTASPARNGDGGAGGDLLGIGAQLDHRRPAAGDGAPKGRRNRAVSRDRLAVSAECLDEPDEIGVGERGAGADRPG